MTDPERDNVQRSLGRVEEGLRRLTDQVEAQRQEATEGRSRIHERIDAMGRELGAELAAHDTRIRTVEDLETGRKKVKALLLGVVGILSGLFGAFARVLADMFRGA